MTSEQLPQNEKDTALWEIAEKRVKFKGHLLIYVLVNTFLWVLWFYSEDKNDRIGNGFNFPWPLCSMLGWGIGLAVQFVGAYTSTKSSALQNEYNKLKNKST
ncbi:MAG: 2TM domain-containing protein [Ferruginibacter sp.]